MMDCCRRQGRHLIRLILGFTVSFVLLSVTDVIRVFPSVSTALREANERLQFDTLILDQPSYVSTNVTKTTITTTKQFVLNNNNGTASGKINVEEKTVVVDQRNNNNNNNNNDKQKMDNITAMMVGKTKIVAFTDFGFRFVAANWYERLQALGYTTHVIVAVDYDAVEFFANQTTYPYEVMIRPQLPPPYNRQPYIRKLRHIVEQIFAIRWKYILSQLQQGVHVLLTDCDNIFTRYVPLSEFENSEFDAFHAYETRNPDEVFQKQGFCVCGGMSWFRADRKVIRLVQKVISQCRDLCDDQVVLNRIIYNNLKMTWDNTPYQLGPPTSNQTEDRFNGLPQFGISGTSGWTGHRVKIWDRDFAFRGPLNPNPCPSTNWVSMPLFDAYIRQGVWMDKLKAFEIWDRNCGGVHNISFGIQYLPVGFHGNYNRRPGKLE